MVFGLEVVDVSTPTGCKFTNSTLKKEVDVKLDGVLTPVLINLVKHCFVLNTFK